MATATAAATATATEATASTATAGSTFLSFVYGEGAPIELCAIHLLHRLLRRSAVCETHETEAARATRVPIRHHLGILNGAEAFERFPKPLIVRIPTEAAYKESITHTTFAITSSPGLGQCQQLVFLSIPNQVRRFVKDRCAAS